MKESFKVFLSEQGILPYTDWESLIIDHSEGSDIQEERKNIQTNLNREQTGVYIYTRNTDQQVLYIGEGKIASRLKRHYRKAYKNEKKFHESLFLQRN